MNIRNTTEFATFISGNDLTNSDSSLIQLINCINTYKAGCDCWKKDEKLKLYNTCAQLYFHAVKHVLPKLKNEILAKTSERHIIFFSDQGHVIGSISR